MTLADEQTEGEREFILISSVSGHWTQLDLLWNSGSRPVAWCVYCRVTDKTLSKQVMDCCWMCLCCSQWKAVAYLKRPPDSKKCCAAFRQISWLSDGLDVLKTSSPTKCMGFIVSVNKSPLFQNITRAAYWPAVCIQIHNQRVLYV